MFLLFVLLPTEKCYIAACILTCVVNLPFIYKPSELVSVYLYIDVQNAASICFTYIVTWTKSVFTTEQKSFSIHCYLDKNRFQYIVTWTKVVFNTLLLEQKSIWFTFIITWRKISMFYTHSWNFLLYCCMK